MEGIFQRLWDSLLLCIFHSGWQRGAVCLWCSHFEKQVLICEIGDAAFHPFIQVKGTGDIYDKSKFSENEMEQFPDPPVKSRHLIRTHTWRWKRRWRSSSQGIFRFDLRSYSPKRVIISAQNTLSSRKALLVHLLKVWDRLLVENLSDFLRTYKCFDLYFSEFYLTDM